MRMLRTATVLAALIAVTVGGMGYNLHMPNRQRSDRRDMVVVTAPMGTVRFETDLDEENYSVVVDLFWIQEDLDWMEQHLEANGFEMMDEEECPFDWDALTMATRIWCAKKDGGVT